MRSGLDLANGIQPGCLEGCLDEEWCSTWLIAFDLAAWKVALKPERLAWDDYGRLGADRPGETMKCRTLFWQAKVLFTLPQDLTSQ